MTGGKIYRVLCDKLCKLSTYLEFANVSLLVVLMLRVWLTNLTEPKGSASESKGRVSNTARF